MQKHVITEWYIENARGQKNARSVGNVQHAAANVQHVAANVQNGEAAPSAFPEDDAADAEQTEKKEPVKKLKDANIVYSTAGPSGEPPSESPSESSSDSSTPIPSICFLSMVCQVFVGVQGFHLS